MVFDFFFDGVTVKTSNSSRKANIELILSFLYVGKRAFPCMSGLQFYWQNISECNMEMFCLVRRLLSVFHLVWLRHKNELIVRAWEKAVQGLARKYCVCTELTKYSSQVDRTSQLCKGSSCLSTTVECLRTDGYTPFCNSGLV